MFTKEHLDRLFEDLRQEWKGTPDYAKLLRDTHLGVALQDAGRPLDGQIDPRAAALIEKHWPQTPTAPLS